MPDLTTLSALVAQYGPLGLLIFAAVYFGRIYLSANKAGIMASILKGMFSQQTTRAESYLLHGLSATPVIAPIRSFLGRVDTVLGKVQENAIPKVMLAPGPAPGAVVVTATPAPTPPPAPTP